MGWTLSTMPSQEGRTWVVTGANSGIGLETVRELARRGATVVMTSRDAAKGQAAATLVRDDVPHADLDVRSLDLASLASVRAFADEVLAAHPVIDGLIDNAGVMAIPRKLTVDGFETQFATNHLGHFALTLRLLPALEKAARPRVVVVASTAHQWGSIAFDDLMGERSYSPDRAYGQSKLANLLFTYELQRRLQKLGMKTVVAAAHPGYSATNLLTVGPKLSGSRWRERLLTWTNGWLAQPAAAGALPTLYAATAEDVEPGGYYGPDGWFQLRGHPTRVKSNAASMNTTTAERLWQVSEQLTGESLPKRR